MDITPALPKNTNFIKGYGPKGIKVGDLLLDYDFILSANLLEPWQTKEGIFAHSSYHKFFDILKKLDNTINPIVIIGTGKIYQSPPMEFFNFFALKNITPEVMSTPSAARTFNVLVAESREVVALIKI